MTTLRSLFGKKRQRQKSRRRRGGGSMGHRAMLKGGGTCMLNGGGDMGHRAMLRGGDGDDDMPPLEPIDAPMMRRRSRSRRRRGGMYPMKRGGSSMYPMKRGGSRRFRGGGGMGHRANP